MTYNPAPEQNVFQARLQRDSTILCSLQRYKGSVIDVHGERVDPGSGGINIAPSTNLIDATGADAGVSMSALTLYYIYVSNSLATFAPNGLRASTTAPSVVTSGVSAGVQYLGTSGNALNWRFVGWIFTTVGNEFFDNETTRNIGNYYNRIRKRMYNNPEYADNNLATSISFTSTTWAALNGGVEDILSYIANGEDSVELAVYGSWHHDTATQFADVGIGRDGAAAPENAVRQAFPDTGQQETFCVRDDYIPAVGRRQAQIVMVTGGGTLSVNVDLVQNGAPQDPRCTAITGHVWV